MKDSVTLEQAGLDFTLMVVKLYRSKKYKYEGEILSEKLLEAGVDAGAMLDTLAKSTLDEDKRKFSSEALAAVTKVEHILLVMQDRKIYKGKKVAPILDCVAGILEALQSLDNALMLKQENRSHKNVVLSMPRTVNQTVAGPVAVAATVTSNNQEDDGFNAPYDG
jgi:hypothetical protein